MQLTYLARPLAWPPIILDVQQALANLPDVSIVGGAVRDAYREYPLKDIDLAVPHDGRPVARQIANAFGGDYYALDSGRGVGRAIITYNDEKVVIDVAEWRADTLLDDLRDRDFTINAMAVPLDSDLSGIYDPLGGLTDLQNRILRRCSAFAIERDPVRVLRAIRMSAAYQLTIEPQTRQDLRTYGAELLTVSAERLRDEFFALLDLTRAEGGLRVLDLLGLLPHILPEIEPLSTDQRRQTLNITEYLNKLLTVVSPRRDDNAAANVGLGSFVFMLDRYRAFFQAHLAQLLPNDRTHRMLLLFTALMAQTGRAESEDNAVNISAENAIRRAIALKLSNHEVRRVQEIITWQTIPAELYPDYPLEPVQIYRFWRLTGETGIDVCWLAMADYLAQAEPQLDVDQWTRYLRLFEQLFDGYDNAMNLVPLVSGDDVMQALNLQPGPQIGQLLEALREAQALGEITTPEEAIAYAEDWMP